MAETNETTTQKIEFWFDPVCPWTWITSRWMAEVNEANDLSVIWQPFSLRVLNESSEQSRFETDEPTDDRIGKLLVTIQNELGNEKVAEVYSFIGDKFHNERRKDRAVVLEEAVKAADIDVSILERSDSADADAALRQSTGNGIKLVGPDVGVPIVAIDSQAFFGPVVSPAPKGEDAQKLWQAVSLAITTPGFSELKRARFGGLDFS